MVQIILVGPPGTGKGTIAQFIRENFGIKHISSGDLLREEVKKGTKLGKEVGPIMKSGKLVDDKIVTGLIEKEIMRLKRNFMLDGYPRNKKQIKILSDILAKDGEKVDLVIKIATDEDLIIRRLSLRRQCEKCGTIYGMDFPPKKEGVCDKCNGKLFQREDDRPEVIRERLEIYHKIMEPVIKHYGKEGALVEIDGNLPKDRLLEETRKVVEENLRR